MQPKFAETNEQFSTGARRGSQAGKPRPDLSSPFAAMRKGVVNAHGATNYGERNYEKGMNFSRVIASIHRHLRAYEQGDLSEDHLAQLGWNVDALLHFEELIKIGLLPGSLDDLPRYKQRTYEGYKRYLDSLPSPLKTQASLGTGARTELGVDLDKCGTTDGVTPLPDISHHRTPGIDAQGNGVYEPADPIAQFDSATADKYAGEWNYSSQGPGYYTIWGDVVLLRDAQFCGEVVQSSMTPKTLKEEIDTGYFVRNTWVCK